MNHQNDLLNNSLLAKAALAVLIISIGWISIIGSSILLPLMYSILFAIILQPILQSIKSIFKIDWLSILLSILIFFVPVLILFTLFGLQLSNIINELPSLQDSLNKAFNSVLQTLQSSLPGVSFQLDNAQIGSLLQKSAETIGSGIVNSTQSIFSILLVILYTFFILLYRKRFQKILVADDANDSNHSSHMITEIQEAILSYIRGLGIVVLILSVLNSLGLWVIGVRYPFFWGTLAGLLAVIPYIGTIIGGSLPLLYCIATMDYSWQPWAVGIYYIIIQQIEGNIITPKIIGNQVNVNPLFAIISLMIFGAMWGLAGIFIALPLTSVIRIILEKKESTKKIAYLMQANE